jgi:DNA modification methylase
LAHALSDDSRDPFDSCTSRAIARELPPGFTRRVIGTQHDSVSLASYTAVIQCARPRALEEAMNLTNPWLGHMEAGSGMQLRLDETLMDSRPLVTSHEPVPARPPSTDEIRGGKGSIFYRAHSYHTKVPPEGIVGLIRHYTDPGDVVVDPFCGSGMTGVACLMTGRQALLSDLSPAACHIASGYTARIDRRRLEAAGSQMLGSLASLETALYGTSCPVCSGPSRIEYTVWSDVFACPSCNLELLFWGEAVDPETGAIRKSIDCSCGSSWAKRDLMWLRSVPVLESISCSSCRRRVEREIDETERSRVLDFKRRDIKAWYPTRPFESWREMWRGQHGVQGIETAADFYTPRNLHALAATWDAINAESAESVRQGLRFAFTAILNRASRRYQWNPKRPTNVLSSTMYLASLSYEFNVFSLLRRKLTAAVRLYAETESLPGSATVHRSPAQRLAHVPDSSAHYVFTDPPFGSNIFYADSSLLWEAWLDEVTDTSAEAVVHRSQAPEHGGKSLQDYEKLMTEAFSEVARILRPNAWASVMFHNSSDEVWSALDRAVEAAGFEVAAAVAFDKSQASFKGLKGSLAGERVPNFDLVLHLQRHGTRRPRRPTDAKAHERVESQLRAHVATASANHRSTAYLHSLAMRVLLEEKLPLEGFSYAAVEELCGRLFEWDGHGWALPVDGGSDG